MHPCNRIFAIFTVVIFAGCASPPSVSPSESAPRYFPTRSATDSRFFTSIERVGKCEIKGKPIPPGSPWRLMVPYQLYPPDSLRNYEEGTVQIQLVFDPGWCVRKASVVKSSGYWRLDAVSLEWAITQKWTPPDPIIVNGEPTKLIPIGWAIAR